MNPAKTAVVTGAAGGIGLESARSLAATGAHVMLLDRSEQVQDAAAAIRADGLEARAFVVDLADLSQTRAAADRVLAMCDGVDILVNNAGIHPKVDGHIAGFEDIRVEDWEAVFRVNTTVPFMLCQHFIGSMKRKQWGRIVNIASRAGRTYSERAGTHYSASKAAVIGLTRKIAGDYASFGITANCIAPGQILTPLARQFAPELLVEIARRIPAKRLGTVADVASAVVYLASDGAGFVNGTVVDVNGGESML